MHITYSDIIGDKPCTVRMPWIGMADAACVYQAGTLADAHQLFGPDWFDEDGAWPMCHVWRELGDYDGSRTPQGIGPVFA